MFEQVYRYVVELEVWREQVVVSPDETARLDDVRGERRGRWPVGPLVDDTGFQEVLQVTTDTVAVGADLDTAVAEVVGWADTRRHEELWGINRACREDDFLAGLGGSGRARR